MEALEWVRFVLNSNSPMPDISDWKVVFDFANKQKITGVCDPSDYPVSIQRDLLFKWLAEIQLIKNQSALLIQRTVELYTLLQKAGFRCCVLKGQGNAMMYPDPLKRMPGDIDVWIDADERTIYEYVKSLFPDAQDSFKHIKFPLFTDIPVDVHQTPLKFRHPIYKRRLQKWIESNKERQFKHFIRLKGTGVDIAVPSARFNAVYQLGHIFTHLFDEGVGLRHFVDYYYVLKKLEGISEIEKEQIRKDWGRLGMVRLASAVMWIEHEVLGLPENLLLLCQDEQLGRLILDDVLDGGNFGKFSQRQQNVGRGRMNKRMATFRRLYSFMPFFPVETMLRLLARLSDLIIIESKKVLGYS